MFMWSGFMWDSVVAHIIRSYLSNSSHRLFQLILELNSFIMGFDIVWCVACRRVDKDIYIYISATDPGILTSFINFFVLATYMYTSSYMQFMYCIASCFCRTTFFTVILYFCKLQTTVFEGLPVALYVHTMYMYTYSRNWSSIIILLCTCVYAYIVY